MIIIYKIKMCKLWGNNRYSFKNIIKNRKIDQDILFWHIWTFISGDLLFIKFYF